ncbi:hypothetical protein A1O1_04296 [Capronia coronata CBS 617.96]|uniref:Roadblock/LAMTOR2 domain-containing protein n=1 Tax=Capronia coronata CBS 617.96 TaxID=1182541 RepID=W9YE80_9EURO|nr:uncharacterized protein A1O1_04296 [Capronia coronata CBS 617.96]EXJ91187.1 hypothetical protein A1O1_04296 [Capronia coronata CBS 617.96]
MGQVCLLDSDRLSALLREALSWNENVSSLMVSATNGSILAYAYRGATPSIKAMRTQSTTMTAAYTVASEDSLVFEAQNTGAISVITPIGDHVLLAVTGPEPKQRISNSMPNGHPEEEGDTAQQRVVNGRNGSSIGDDRRREEEEQEEQEEERNGHHYEEEGEDDHQRQIRTDLEVVGQELASVLRDELAAMKWPDDI